MRDELQEKLKKNQASTLAILEQIGQGSAYDIMDAKVGDAKGMDIKVYYAMAQAISGACSNLHRDNIVHAIGKKVNESSGELVMVYAINNNPKAKCPCGDCPDGGKGYKARYLKEVEERKQEKKDYEERIETLIMFNDRKNEQIAELQSELASYRPEGGAVAKVLSL